MSVSPNRCNTTRKLRFQSSAMASSGIPACADLTPDMHRLGHSRSSAEGPPYSGRSARRPVERAQGIGAWRLVHQMHDRAGETCFILIEMGAATRSDLYCGHAA